MLYSMCLKRTGPVPLRSALKFQEALIKARHVSGRLIFRPAARFDLISPSLTGQEVIHMRDSNSSRDSLGRLLATVYPHPVSVLLGCVPGLVLALVMWSNGGLTDLILLLLNPEAKLATGMYVFLSLWLLVTLFFLWLGLRHILDRAELCRDGFRLLGKVYRFDQIGPISWSHHSSSGMTRFWDCTVMSFTYQGKSVRIKTRYLQDLSYQFHRVYGPDASGGSGGLSRPAHTDSEYRARPR